MPENGVSGQAGGGTSRSDSKGIHLYARKSGIELFRLICCFLVIEGHVFLEFFPRVQYENHAIAWQMFASIMVVASSLNNPGFMCISGHYGVKYSFAKVLSFEYMILIYSWCDLIIRFVYGHGKELETMVKGLFPLMTGKYWYATAYMVLMILSPAINYIIEKTDRSFYRRIVVSVGFLFMIIPSFLYWGPNGEYSVNFVVMIVYYFLVQYIKKYDLVANISSLKLVLLAVLDYLFMVAVNFVLSVFVGASLPFGYFMPLSRSCSVFMFVFSICVFELFRRMNFYCAVINILAQYTFAAYILDVTIRFIISQHIDIYSMANSVIGKLAIMTSYVFLIFVSALIIEFFRRKTIGKFEGRVYKYLYSIKGKVLKIVSF